jgi:glutathione S-transferase
MKLYYIPGACSMADHIALEWIGQPYETHRLAREALRSPEYLAINPTGLVPALVDDDGWALTENVAILNYLADKFPIAELGGMGIRGRAEVNRWLAYLNSDVHPTFKPLFTPQRFIGDESKYAQLQELTRAKLHIQFERLNAHMADRHWLAGTRSIADTYLFVVLRWAKAKQVDLHELDHLHVFFDRMHADEGVKAVMQAEGL